MTEVLELEVPLLALAENPAASVKLIDDGRTEDGWTYLTLEEQMAPTRSRTAILLH
ncbi:MAG TPA: hypothetical protein VH062_01395 [Polyangiaceae bacterium]|nr:hypothetical protein [Polyangiaceae bacterium]